MRALQVARTGQLPGHLPPFTQVRVIGCFETFTDVETGYRAFLLLAHEGRVAMARLPLNIESARNNVYEQTDKKVRDVLDTFSGFDIERRLQFHRDLHDDIDLLDRLPGAFGA